jgi:hypothetical protein
MITWLPKNEGLLGNVIVKLLRIITNYAARASPEKESLVALSSSEHCNLHFQTFFKVNITK